MSATFGKPEPSNDQTDLSPNLAASKPVVAAVEFLEDADPFPPEVIAKLARPIDPGDVEAKPPHGLLYAPWSKYQDVLLDAFGPGGFRMVPLSPARKQDKEMTWHGALLVRIPGQRKFQFIKSATGECAMHAGMSVANAIEGAESDCLTKCCKRLGIFKELFDPAWRRAWEAKYKGQHAKDVAQANWPEARAAAPKEAAPAVPKAASATSSASSPKGTAPNPGTSTAAPRSDSSAPRSGPKKALSPPPASPAQPGPISDSTPPKSDSSPAFADSPSTAAADTGEAATDDQKATIRANVKRLGWKGHYAKMWLKTHFGFESPDSLTADQALNATLLLEAWGTDKFPPLLADMRNDGLVRPEQAA